VTQISIHYQRMDDTVQVVNNSVNTQWVLIVDPESTNSFPGKKVVGRFYDELEQELVPNGIFGADKWWDRNLARVRAVTYLHAIIVCNEPQGSAAAVNAYMARWIHLCNYYFPNLCTVAGNFSVGTPVSADAAKYAESIRLATYLGFHVYWVPDLWKSEYAWAIRDVFYRYKEFMNALPDDIKNKPILITECGCDGLINSVIGKPTTETGWIDYYNCNREAYNKHLQDWKKGLDSRVLAVFVYTAGPWGRWLWYTVDKALAQLMLDTNQKESGVNTIRVKDSAGVVQELDIEEYVKGVVPCEVYPSWPTAALCAQAVAARSYALYNKAHPKHTDCDVCNTQHCQVWNPERRESRTDAAVESTRGIVAVNKLTKEIAATFFSAACGGQTLNTWGNWLKSTTCPCGAHGKTVSGHRQGMCQWGAYYLASAGYDWLTILEHYYDVAITADYGAGAVLNPEVDAVTLKLDNMDELINKVQACAAELRVLLKK
jgi:hypothetical protein